MNNTQVANYLQRIDEVKIFGIRIHALTVNELHRAFSSIIDNHLRALVLHVNVHCLNHAYEQPWLANLLNRADIVYCDGGGVALGARMLNQYLPGRITLADWLWKLAEFAEGKGYSLYFLGASEGVADKAAKRLQERYPNLRIAGTHHGYFDKTLGGIENGNVVSSINDSEANILIVGFGMPIQERWLEENWPKLKVQVAISGGAIFDFISGDLKRAPTWMNNNNLEWLGRLLVEPQRLWRRYLMGNPLFLIRVLKERILQTRSTP